MTLFGGGAKFLSVLLKYLNVVLSFFLKIEDVRSIFFVEAPEQKIHFCRISCHFLC